MRASSLRRCRNPRRQDKHPAQAASARDRSLQTHAEPSKLLLLKISSSQRERSAARSPSRLKASSAVCPDGTALTTGGSRQWSRHSIQIRDCRKSRPLPRVSDPEVVDAKFLDSLLL